MAAVTYLWPATALVAPAAAVVKDRVVASVSTVTAAGAIQIVTNMGVTAAQLLAGQPIVEINPILPEAIVNQAIVSGKTANGVTITVLSGNSTLSAIVVTVRRPHTIGD